MTLSYITLHLEWFRPLLAIYAAEPWTEESAATLIPVPDEGKIPQEAIPAGYSYFLDVFFAEGHLVALRAELASEPTLRQKCDRLIRCAMEESNPDARLTRPGT